MRYLAAFLLIIVGGGPALANEDGDPVAGQVIAAAECAACHAIAETGASPNPAAPPFRTFGSKWPIENLQEALAEGLSVGHSEMPEFIFEPREIDDLLAFLLTIQEQGP